MVAVASAVAMVAEGAGTSNQSTGGNTQPLFALCSPD
jgi:hypothetical protein